MKIYNYDENGEFTHESASREVLGEQIIPANATKIKVLAEKKGFARVFSEEQQIWEYKKDLRGTAVYSIDDKSESKINYLGEIKDGFTPLEPTEYEKWNGEKWVLTAAAKKQQLADVKALKLGELNSAAASVVEAAAKLSETPAFERASWEIQRQEATAWHADNSSATPVLDIIARTRGIPAETLRQKAYEKATLYQQLTAVVAGQRQHLEDIITGATTLADVDAINITFAGA